MEIIRKRNVEEMIKNTSREHTAAIHANNNKKNLSLQKCRNLKSKQESSEEVHQQRLHSWQDRKFSITKRKPKKCGFLTIQAIDTT